jgi:hypothetical protein
MEQGAVGLLLLLRLSHWTCKQNPPPSHCHMHALPSDPCELQCLHCTALCNASIRVKPFGTGRSGNVMVVLHESTASIVCV